MNFVIYGAIGFYAFEVKTNSQIRSRDLRALHEFKKDPESAKLMDFLNEKIDNIEIKIKKVSDELVDEMHKDIREARKVAK